MKTGKTRAARDRSREQARAYRARERRLRRVMERHGWRWHRGLGLFVPAVTR